MRDEYSPIMIATKRWGHEKIISNDHGYCGKMLYIIKGCQTSLHYHMAKHETFYLDSGKLIVYYSDEVDKIQKISESEDEDAKLFLFAPGNDRLLSNITLRPGDKFEVPRMRVHKIIALEDSKLFEFSNRHDEHDIIKLMKDDLK